MERLETHDPEETLKAKEDEAKKRYERKTPPGFMDCDSKDDIRRYGDAILWFQVLDKAKSAKRDVILVTDDRKTDWWWKTPEEDLTLAARGASRTGAI